MPLFPSPPTEQRAEQYCRDHPPLAESRHFAVYRLPGDVDTKALLADLERTVQCLLAWIDSPPPEHVPTYKIVVYGTGEAEGRRFLRYRSRSARAVGETLPSRHLIVAAADAADDRLGTVLRHEAVHAMLRTLNRDGDPLPFWMNEGLAAFLEQGVTAEGAPRINRERLACVRRNRDGAERGIHRVLSLSPDARGTGVDYAWAYALVNWLYRERSDRPENVAGSSSVRAEQRHVPWWVRDLSPRNAGDCAAAVLRSL